jgi:hypothetical protein
MPFGATDIGNRLRCSTGVGLGGAASKVCGDGRKGAALAKKAKMPAAMYGVDFVVKFASTSMYAFDNLNKKKRVCVGGNEYKYYFRPGLPGGHIRVPTERNISSFDCLELNGSGTDKVSLKTKLPASDKVKRLNSEEISKD